MLEQGSNLYPAYLYKWRRLKCNLKISSFHGLFFLLTRSSYRTKLCHLRGKIRIGTLELSHIFKSEHQLRHFSFALPFCLFMLTSLHCHGPLNMTDVIQTEKEINCKRHSVWKHWRVPRLTSFVIPFYTLHVIKSIIRADQCQNPTSTKSGYNYAYIMYFQLDFRYRVRGLVCVVWTSSVVETWPDMFKTRPFSKRYDFNDKLV